MKVREFVKQWQNVSGERANYQKFWLMLIRDVFNVDKPENFICFEVPVKHGFIDAYLPDTNTLIEQKSSAVKLDEEIFLQAKRYDDALEWSRKARRIITCNFREFLIYDMETLEPPVKILLEELPEKFHALDFLIDKNKNKIRIELELSLQAGEIVAKIYDALLTQYINPNAAESLASLNKLCVRLVFCLYAESSGIFGKHKIFRDYLSREYNLRRALIDLFEVLNTPTDKRDPYLDDTLKKFPYVNGGLFDGAIEIPNFTPEIKELLLEEASSGFNWSGISPTIFGAVFESTLNPETRRAGGMHYTSLENIHKVIDELFLNDLREEFSQLKTKKQLRAFHDKLAAIKIFDPACGSGNFLTESYLSLRRLENDLLRKILGSQIQLGELDDPIKVSIKNFYGIEINDFAVAVAQTALWIAELQMMIDTQEIIHRDLNFLPLKSYANIRKGNALRLDWKELFRDEGLGTRDIVGNSELVPSPYKLVPNYIIGNPPFVGYSNQSKAQKADMQSLFVENGKPHKKAGKIDYVAGWYLKASEFMRGNTVRSAFVSTNSIAQGEQALDVWKFILSRCDIHIDFAHRTFRWESESPDMAHVHCVVIGFSTAPNPKPKKIFTGKDFVVAQNINFYLLDGKTIFIESRALPLCPVPHMTTGNRPADGGALIIEAKDYADFIRREPAAKKFIKRLIGSEEFINGKLRYCLWLVDATPAEIRRLKLIYERVKLCRENRLNGAPDRQKLAETPHLFRETKNPAQCVVVPKVSGDRRKYIPMDIVGDDVILTDLLFMIPDATLYHFGVLMSSIHMAWTRVTCGRLGVSYRYSATVVYNNFIWCTPTPAQKSAIEATAQKILDVRKKYMDRDEALGTRDIVAASKLVPSPYKLVPTATFADLYDEVTMPRDLREAHRANDRAVAKAYGFEEILDNEAALVAELFDMYDALTKS